MAVKTAKPGQYFLLCRVSAFESKTKEAEGKDTKLFTIFDEV